MTLMPFAVRMCVIVPMTMALIALRCVLLPMFLVLCVTTHLFELVSVPSRRFGTSTPCEPSRIANGVYAGNLRRNIVGTNSRALASFTAVRI